MIYRVILRDGIAEAELISIGVAGFNARGKYFPPYR
jgi:hypothetical protein